MVQFQRVLRASNVADSRGDHGILAYLTRESSFCKLIAVADRSTQAEMG